MAQPSRRFERVFSDVGGLTQAEAAGQLPRNVRQASYEAGKDSFKAKDPIFEITSAIRGYNESGDERFIRTYTLDDSSAKLYYLQMIRSMILLTSAAMTLKDTSRYSIVMSPLSLVHFFGGNKL